MKAFQRAVVVVSIAAVFGVIAARSQSSQNASTAGQKTAAEQFKNIQVLKDIPADQLIPTMRYIAASLGVECGFCHVRENGRLEPAKDDKKTKRTAREMMKMVMTINQENFHGRQQVSCNSCHNGHMRPSIAPAVATETSLQERMQNEAGERAEHLAEGGAAARPSAASLFDKYEQAIGGASAVDKLTSLYAKGTVSLPMGNAQFEQYNKAPDQFWSSITTARGERVQAFDGSQGWMKFGPRTEPMRDVSEMKANADFYRTLKLASQYQGARVFGQQKIDHRDAWVVRARIPNSPLTDMLYFATDSGLLLRRTTLRHTALGPLPTTMDFADYRDVSGVKMPFQVTVSTPESVETMQITEMKANVPVEDSRFAMPKAGQ